MAIAFYDNFDRANGPLGASWVVDAGSPSIVSNQASLTSSTQVHPATIPQSADYAQRILLVTPTVFTKSVTMRMRASLDGANYYAVTFAIYADHVLATITQRVNSSSLTSNAIPLYFTWGASIDLMCAVAGDQLLAWVNGYLIYAGNLAGLTARGYCQIVPASTSMMFDDYSLYDLATSPLSVTVTPTETPGEFTIDLVNGGAPWTPGTPGSPEFQSSAGTITTQTVVDADHATLTYVAPEITAPYDVYDPQGDWYYRLDLALTMEGVGGGGGGGGGLTVPQAETMDELADYLTHWGDAFGNNVDILIQLGSFLLSFSAHAGGSPNPAYDDIVYALLDTNGRLAVIDAQSYSAMSLISGATNAGAWTLQSVWQYVQGTGAHTIADVLDAIAALGAPTGGDLTTILEQLALIRTANLWTFGHVKDWIDAIPAADVSAVLEELALIRTANLWTLGHVKDWIDAIPTTDYSAAIAAIKAVVDLIPTDPIRSLQPALDAIAGVRGSGNPDLAAVLTAIAAIPTNPITDLSGVLSAIAALSTSLTDKYAALLAAIQAIAQGAATPTAPVWPGLANVTLGTPVSLGLTFASSEACDGVIVALTADPHNHGLYDWGSVLQHPRAAYLAFVTDNGDYSEQHVLNFPSQLICVTGMLHADGFIGRGREGLTGSVTPWTINTP